MFREAKANGSEFRRAFAWRIWRLKYHLKREKKEDIKMTHLEFADDTVVFRDVDLELVDNLNMILNCLSSCQV